MRPDTVLVVTASYDIAAGYVLEVLRERGSPAFRLNTDEFPSKIKASFVPPSSIRLADGEAILAAESVKSVWYRRHVMPMLPSGVAPGIKDFCEREVDAFLGGVLATLPTDRWMSSPHAIVRAERKPYQLAVASRLGFEIPHTLITNDPFSVADLAGHRQLIAKAISSGYVASPKGNRAIFTSALCPEDLEELEGLALAPVLFQELIDKTSDIRVTVVADEVFAAEILSQESSSSRVDWRATKNPHLPHRVHDLPLSISELCVELVDYLGLVFGAIDLALRADGTYVFFEINPNGEWLWLEDQLGFPISTRIAQWLDAGGD